MAQFELVSSFWNEGINDITTDKEKYIEFLEFAARMYNHSFSDSLLIYKQRPNAKIVASMDSWNKIGRRIHKGSTSIGVFNKNHTYVKRYFDIKDTYGDTPVRLWSISLQSISALKKQYVTEYNAQDIQKDIMFNCIHEKVLRDCNAEIETAIEMLEDYSPDTNKLTDFISWSSAFIVSKRLMQNSKFKITENFDFDFTQSSVILDEESIVLIGETICQTARTTINNVISDIKNINKRRNEYESDNKQSSENENSKRDNIYFGQKQNVQSSLGGNSKQGTGRADRNMGTKLATLDGTAARSSGINTQTTSPDSVAQQSSRGGQGSQSEIRNPEQTIRQEEPSATKEQPIISQVEKDEGIGDTAYNLHGDSIQGEINTDSTATSEITEVADSISQGEIDTVLLRGSGFAQGKFRIYENCKKYTSNKDFAKFLKKEYGIGGSSPDENGVRQDHDSKGLHLSKGNIFNPSAEITLTWNKTAKRIRELIKTDVYLNRKELDEFKTYFIENLVGKTLIIDNKEFQVDSINGDNVSLKDISFKNSTGFPIFRKESIDFVINEINKKTQTSDDIEKSEFSFDNLAEQENTNEDMQMSLFDMPEINEKQNDKIISDTIIEKPKITENPTKENQPVITKIDYIYNSENEITGGAKARFKANIEAIKTLKLIESENRLATADEQQILSRYSGWGGSSNAFSSSDNSWSEEYTILKNLLTDDEYTQARASTLTSFYTPPEITQSINLALSQFGFKGGNILEPAMGIGNFFAHLPKEMKNKSKLYGVEIDDLTGRIAKQLFQTANIQINGFEKTNFSDNSFDVVVGNVPFCDIGVSDKVYDKYNFKIHDYFFAKAVDKLKPNGVLAFVTSSGTLDKKSSKLREYIAERCDLIGAVRLPQNAFKSSGTKVVSDIIFLQKREERATDIPEWTNTAFTEQGFLINKYFVDNPQMILGELKAETRFGDFTDCTVIARDGADLKSDLQNAISFLSVLRPIEETNLDIKIEKEIISIPADLNVRNFTHTLIDNELYYRENSKMIKVEENEKTLQRMKGLLNLNNLLREIIQAQNDNCTDEELTSLQKSLSDKYDNFVSKFGYITNRENAKCYSHDDNYNLLCTLETIDGKTKKIAKADIFTQRTIKPEKVITHVDTAIEALHVSLDMQGKVDLYYMSSIMENKPVDELVAELGGAIFLNPLKMQNSDDKYNCYEEASEYLSGDVRQKLKLAKLYVDENPEFEENIKALEKVQPEPLGAGDIVVRLGCSWIAEKDYNDFIYSIFETPQYKRCTESNIKYGNVNTLVRVKKIKITGEWKITNKTSCPSVLVDSTFGTSRMNGYQIVENLLNQRSVQVRDRVEDGDTVRYILNKKETQLAEEKARLIKEHFPKWFWEDQQRRQHYVEKYNDLYNGLRGRDYSNIKMSFPQMSPNIKLRKHQKAAVARAVYNGNTLFGHCVGAGKTYEMAAATQERKRLGIINKACVVVPKHLTLQIAKEWLQLYPQAKLLVATQKDFSKENRKRFISKCVTGDYDAVIMSFQQFEKIKMSYDYRKRFITKQLNSIIDSINEADSDDRATVKTLERLKKQYEKRLEKLLNEDRKDNVLEFEQLGFDSLVVDEAHYYKNCYVQTKMSNVSGVSVTPAQKSEDILMKCNYLNEKTNYRGIIFSTGTPVSNGMIELYIMQRYLRPDILKQEQVSHFDDWASQFGEVVTKYEMKVAGDGYKLKSRFSKFVNLPELMNMFKEFSDIVTADMVNLNIPKIKGGKPQIITAEPTQFQKEYMRSLAERSERIQHSNIDPRVDNMLKISHEARLLGLDGRTMDNTSENNPNSKVNLCIQQVIRIYKETEKEKGTQIIWSDIAVNAESTGFSVYDYLVDELISKGIPQEEIVKITDIKTDKARTKLFSDFRNGTKRIIIASTTKLGTGANIQDRLKAVHHLDIPWKPSDLEQRNGRILRQGNMYNEVEVIHYTTKATFDTYMLNIVTTKQKFISQIMTSKSPARVYEDTDDMVITYSEMQAITSGNPMIKEKIELDTEVARLNLLQNEYKNNKFRLQDMITTELPQKISKFKQLIEKSEIDCKKIKSYNTDKFSIEIDGKVFTERKLAGEKLEKEIQKCLLTGETINIGNIGEFKISLKSHRILFNDKQIEADITGKLTYDTPLETGNALGNIIRIENTFKDGPLKKNKQLKTNLKKYEDNLVQAQAEYEISFEHEKELKEKSERLSFVTSQLASDEKEDMFVSESDEVDKAEQEQEDEMEM